MGRQDVKGESDPAQLRTFMKGLLADVRALETMLAEGLIESDVRRVGAEQELFLVDNAWRPALCATDVLARLNDPHFTTELGRFNLEFNLDPFPFGGDCLSRMESQIDALLARARAAAAELDADVMLTGILPTLTKADLRLENMTPNPRYAALNEAVTRMRGGPFEFLLKGADELIIKHDSVMVEAVNASFQVHFQVGHDEFARLYNIAQAVAAPVLAGATNSPLLFGRRLWRETRIAVFQQSVDTRAATDAHHLREMLPRVNFGNAWVKESVLDVFQEDITRFKVLLGAKIDEDPFEMLKAGRTPSLKALCLHNSTVYRWTRPCYGVSDGKPHLRIENRVLPSGPTPIDEIANAAFWFGLISGLADKYDDITTVIDFDDVKTNFLGAARFGLGAQFTWLEGKTVPAQEVICRHLLPLAQDGLQAAGVARSDIDRYLGVIEARVTTEQTGSQWMLKSLAGLRGRGAASEKLSALTAATVARQKQGRPVHEWPLARLEEAGEWKPNYLRVEQYMTTDLVTVHQDELIDLVANMMDWRRIRHICVEDDEHRLVGLVSYRALLRLVGRGLSSEDGHAPAVSSIMRTDPVTVTPETSTLDAIELMRWHKVACLPVIKDGRLVGMVTERNFMDITAQLLQEKLTD